MTDVRWLGIFSLKMHHMGGKKEKKRLWSHAQETKEADN
jgi:hypothetical protein